MEERSARPPKTLTTAEANTLLPRIRPLVAQLRGLQRSIVETNQRLDQLASKLSGGNGYPVQSLQKQLQDLTRHQLQLIEAFQSALKQLEDLGGILKDLEAGLIDFYSLRDGQLVLLCWKLEEERIRFWHTLEGGYAGRQLLE